MEIIAHRGLHRHKEEENTIRAFTNALVVGCSMIELDVQRTKDNHLVVRHDPAFCIKNYTITVGRHLLSELTDSGYVINHYSENELTELPKVPTLELVLKLFLGQIRINIELKGHSGLCLGKALCRLLENEKFNPSLLNDLVVSSFNLNELRDFKEYFHTVQYLKKCYQDVSTGYLTQTLFTKGSRKNLMNTLRESHINAVHLSQDTAHEEAVADFKEEGFLVRVYVVNDIKKLSFYEKMGVDGVFTDRAEEFLGITPGLSISNAAAF